MSNANSFSNTSSSLSAISTTSSTSRKQPPRHLEAIQTQKAQASTSFLPVSTTRNGGDDITQYPSYPPHSGQQTQHGIVGTGTEMMYSEQPLATAATANDGFPFTPSTLVGGILSPVEYHHDYPGQHQKAHIRTSGTLPRRQIQHQYDTSSISDNAPFRASMSSNRQTRHADNLSSSGSSTNGRNGGRYGTRRQQGVAPTYSSSSDDAQSQQLPTLWQVLHRKTVPPVCLFNFYLYMRDYEKSSEEVDFWLDVTAHEVLWRLYVRATKRKQALAAQERSEREEREVARLEAERWKAQMEEEQEKELKKGHQQKHSINLAMYEPHWSAVNRYLEMSEAESDNLSNTGASMTETGSHYNHLQQQTQHQQQYQSSDMTQLSSMQGSDVLTLTVNESTASFPSPNSTTREVPVLPGAVSNNWSHLEDEDIRSKNKHGTGICTASSVSGLSTSTVDVLTAKETTVDGREKGTGTEGASDHQSGTMGTLTTAKSMNVKRGLATSATSPSVTKEDLQRSAERIYCKYLVPQAEKPVRIPGSVRRRVAQVMDSVMMINADEIIANNNNNGNVATTTFSPSSGMETVSKSKSETPSSPSMVSLNSPRNEKLSPAQKQEVRQSMVSQSSFHQPDQDLGLVFAEAREIVFEGMESYYFPRFLKTRAYGNMAHSHRVARAVLGLFILFIGFVIVLCMIFLNLRPRSVRAWALIPIYIGILLCTTFQFNICPLIAAFGVSETRWMKFAEIKEPNILALHRKRATKVLVVSLLYTICVGTVFGLVPGHRL
ncbi:Bud site selection protein, Revert to axial protein 1 [Entomortierella chlamydospora]|uniref:Bud site selection protein, Revert to axial protein 1 n=1 Tax=Entomortierella chlamydospora TaxID=101097 RepID=A0A9P6MTD8_9FUNG|nr:Bud site selection protein, Revert to axial protein 1 [Entomortierella chlamydospora]KAG0012063.1 Bud site selection protein, Revert to axial protein 1 [Entomortierella chlamydospora]